MNKPQAPTYPATDELIEEFEALRPKKTFFDYEDEALAEIGRKFNEHRQIDEDAAMCDVLDDDEEY